MLFKRKFKKLLCYIGLCIFNLYSFSASAEEVKYGVVTYSVSSELFVDLDEACQVAKNNPRLEFVRSLDVPNEYSSKRGICFYKLIEDSEGDSETSTSIPAHLKCHCNEKSDNWKCVPREPETNINWPSQRISTHPVSTTAPDAELCLTYFNETDSEYSCAATPLTNNPINCATGQKLYTEMDYQGFGKDPLVYSRYYQSFDIDSSRDEADSFRWKSSLVPSLTRTDYADGAVLYRFSIGSHVHRVFFRSASKTGNNFSTNPYLSDIDLLIDEQTGHVSITDQAKTTYYFNSENELIRTVDIASKTAYEYEYANVNGLSVVKKISNRFGRFLEFSYNDETQLISLVDQDGIAIHYEYDGLGNLIKVFFPDNTPELLSDNPFKTYLYEDIRFPKYITGILDENGVRISNVTYSQEGKANLSELANGTERVEVSYSGDDVSYVKFYRDVNSNAYREEKYTYGKFRGRYKLTSREITKCDRCALGREEWSFNATNGTLSFYTDMNGTVTQYVYDSTGKLQQVNKEHGTENVQRTQYYYNSDGQLYVERNSEYNRYYYYDSNGNLKTYRENSVD